MRDGLLKTVPLDPAFHRGFGKALENIRGQLYVATLAVELENAVRSSRGNEVLIEIRSSESRVRNRRRSLLTSAATTFIGLNQFNDQAGVRRFAIQGVCFTGDMDGPTQLPDIGAL